MVAPLAKAPGGFEYLFVAIDNFLKSIEVKPMVKYSIAKAAEFIEEIMHRFGIPNRIITDLGSTFTGNEFWDTCENSGIEVCYASVMHPRANRQAERDNALILQGLKARLYEPLKKYGGKWMQELKSVIWGLRTQPSRATGQSPFYLVYGSEAVLPADLLWRAPRLEHYSQEECNTLKFITKK